MLAQALAGFPYVAEMAGSVSHDGVLGACDDDIEFAFGLDLYSTASSAVEPPPSCPSSGAWLSRRRPG